MGSKIVTIEYFLPKNKVTNFDIQNISNNWTAEKIKNKIGIENRYIVSDEETSLDLAYNACIKLFNTGVIKKQEIDALILCTQSPEYFLPTTACILQDKLKLNKETFCIDYNLGCSGYIYGLAIAKGLVKIGVARNLLLVTAETYSKYISNEDFSNKSIFGDAATATLISNDNNNLIKEFIFGTDGSGFENLIVKNGGTKNLNSAPQLYMNGPEIFNFTNLNIPDLVENTLKKNKTEISDIDYFVFHQANKFILEHLRKKIKIEENKFIIDMNNYGNTVSNTIPIVISNLLKNEKNNLKNKTIMLVGFGVGYSWGATIIKFN